MTLISVLKKYGDPHTSFIDEPEATTSATTEETVRVIEVTNENSSIESPEHNENLIGHRDVTARLLDSDDEDVSLDGPWRPSSLELHKQRQQKQANDCNPFKKHPLLNKLVASAQNRSAAQTKHYTPRETSTHRETHCEVSDESSDESYRTPSSSHCDLLSSDSNPPAIPEEREEVSEVKKEEDLELSGKVSEDKSDITEITNPPATPVNKTQDSKLSDVIAQVGQMIVDNLTETRPVPPLNIPRTSTPDRQSPTKYQDLTSNDSSNSEPFTIIPSQSESRPGPNAWGISRAVSSPAWSRTTPVDTPNRRFETLPAPTNLLPKCPVCDLIFTEDHDFSYRNFHANSCIDSLV